MNMSIKLVALVGAYLLCATLASNEVLVNDGSLNDKDMQQLFFRSEETHAQSMASIMDGMSPSTAVQIIGKSSLATPELMQAANMALGKQSSLRKQPKGYSGLDGARKLLNDMIFESMTKYDAEIANVPSITQNSVLLWRLVVDRFLRPTILQPTPVL